MITLITGLPGSGKTLFTINDVNKLAESKESKALARLVYYHGIPDLILPWQILDDPAAWHELPKGSIIVIDECQTTFRPRGAGSSVPKYVSELETHRHHGYDLFLITQHPMLVDGNVRKLVGRHMHVKRFLGFPKSTIHEFQQTRDNVDKSTKGSIENQFFFPKDSYKWYKSANIHTVKKRIPMRILLMILLPILCVSAVFFAVKHIGNFGKTPEELNGLTIHPTTYEPPKSQKNINNDTDVDNMTFIEAHTPEVEGLAYTAPIYKEVTKPITAPYPAACMQSKSQGCNCFSQQGTKLSVPKNLCQEFVTNGFFIDWDSEPKNTKYAKNEQTQPRGLLRGEQPLDGGIAIPPNSVGLGLRASPNNP